VRAGGGAGVSPPVRVVLPGVLREYADGAAELEVSSRGPDGSQATLRSVLDEAVQARPRLAARLRDETGALRRHVNVFVDGKDCRADGGLERVVGESATVHIIPAVSGG